MKSSEQNLDGFLEVVGIFELDDPFIAHYHGLMVKNNLSEYRYHLTKTFGPQNNRIDYAVDLGLDGGGKPYLHGYRATLFDTHPIEHGVFGGIDTRELEERMKDKDWNNSLPELPGVFRDIVQLSLCGREKAVDIAERLEARYWLGTPVEIHLNIGRLREKFAKEHYFQAAFAPSNITAKKAYNLLSGRFIVRYEDTRPGYYKATWVGLKQVDGAASAKSFEEAVYPDFEYGVQLRQLGVLEMATREKGYPLIGCLMDGDLVPANIITGEHVRPVWLSVDPGKRRVVVHGEDLRELDISAATPEQDSTEIREDKLSEALGAKKGKRKGKSIN
ncbi:hypothetical protein JHJ32_07325 [Parapedobacter sp. ISTM3]|uniref:hypothetical protein n=1 Tax=Parapedobacter sp. ISTM3 TaxID=2800130 RepID=UPI001908BEE6|nr:hypothetical protein [Parapedobacter sp. ISTM3]MBK1439788.1 hypothetical protein [Parapedobacter sp. ISTM3]